MSGHRVETVLPTPTYELIKHEAELMGLTMRAFIAMASCELARSISLKRQEVEGRRVIRLGPESSQKVNEWLSDPDKYFGVTAKWADEALKDVISKS